jgi:RNA polymerase-binding transcription factor DksA
MRNPATPSVGADSIAQDARRTRERLLAIARRNPLSERAAAGGDNTPWADRLEELQDDMAKNEYLASREVLVERLKVLSRAEEKVREGTHGLCDACGGMIPAARLKAVPGATHCVPCAERLERQQAAERRVHWEAESQLVAA